MNELIVVLVLVFITLFGVAFLYLFQFLSDLNFWEKIPYGFGLGCGLLAIYMFVLGRIGHWQYPVIITPLLLSIILAIFLRFNQIKQDVIWRFSLDPWDKMLLALIFLQVAYTGFEAWLRPLSAWDGWAIWLLKAKMFYQDGFVNPEIYHLTISQYPYVVNLIGTFIYQTLGVVDDRAVLLFFFFVYLMLGLSFFSFIKSKFSITRSILFTFLLLSLQNIIRHGGRFEAGYADLTLGFYLFLGFTLLQRYLTHSKISTLIPLSLLMGISSLVKEEGFVFTAICQIIIFYHSIFRHKNFNHFLISLIWLLPYIDWQIFKSLNSIYINPYSGGMLDLARFSQIVILMGKELAKIQNWNFLWPIFFLALIFNKKNLKPDAKLALLLLSLQFASYLAIFLITPIPIQVQVPNSFDRLLLHLAPLALYTIAASAKK
ncbi:hypothetical protein A2634_03950 [Candidatus Amesbacteria bacterium RIFCSPHIGHO2_01_FULL_48_32]|uniref:Glycosyltransferase RgtA/B/C/D-like domain-containing protein n=1 Tax=Candidatus Amesbacteria bacterium RIFCSPLOWO2_01_FULL_48_25 TaxID=1797259 RepID=A0A1F4ZCM6_9BACT|nr:MAG: hypothetical protein A2634_03950 [Candidatus Amesbacteria bacterium RIFCSPHIGHO2_01_FULL_48_32]OGD03507.1 MAG: hypothetical protein A2989_02680 [Candidatus Amesbacteria bacterium RIFCSPLOWO2_01_FULL_48_25]HJZ05816.1 hypothetical protein [Patescibacteria group bacterium]